MTPLWVADRVWRETLLLPAGDRQQNLFRSLFSTRREQDLLTDESARPREALDWALIRTRTRYPGYRPQVSVELLRG